MVLRPPGRPLDLVPPLVASGALCLGLLVRHGVPGLAWLSLVFASLAAAGIPIALSRGVDPGAVGLNAWLVMAGRSIAAAIVTMGIAALYATRPERPAARQVTSIATLLVAWLTPLLVIVLLVSRGTG